MHCVLRRGVICPKKHKMIVDSFVSTFSSKLSIHWVWLPVCCKWCCFPERVVLIRAPVKVILRLRMTFTGARVCSQHSKGKAFPWYICVPFWNVRPQLTQILLAFAWYKHHEHNKQTNRCTQPKIFMEKPSLPQFSSCEPSLPHMLKCEPTSPQFSSCEPSLPQLLKCEPSLLHLSSCEPNVPQVSSC